MSKNINIRSKTRPYVHPVKKRFDGTKVTLNRIWISSMYPIRQEEIAASTCDFYDADPNSYTFPECS